MTDWNMLNLLARSYLELQRTRVAMDLRLFKLRESALVDSGLYTIVETKEESNGKSSKSRIVKPTNKPETEEEEKILAEKEAAIIEKLKEHDIYKILSKHRLQIKKQEKQVVQDALPFFDDTELWNWCIDTKGLAEVAALTYAGFLNPDKFHEVGKVWAKAGLEPRGKKIKGEQAVYSPLIKSRFWILTNNVIMAQDPYYYPIYKIKKDYFQNRPDILAVKETQKGWKASQDRRAKFVLTKLLVAHAYSAITNFDVSVNHSNPVPIRPKDPTEFAVVHERYTRHHAEILEKLKKLWIEGEEKKEEGENKQEKYWNILRHTRNLAEYSL